jgi:hypothetical protein
MVKKLLHEESAHKKKGVLACQDALRRISPTNWAKG